MVLPDLPLQESTRSCKRGAKLRKSSDFSCREMHNEEKLVQFISRRLHKYCQVILEWYSVYTQSENTTRLLPAIIISPVYHCSGALHLGSGTLSFKRKMAFYLNNLYSSVPKLLVRQIRKLLLKMRIFSRIVC